MDERNITVQTIERLERYFKTQFTEDNDVPEEVRARQLSFQYAIEAYKDIVSQTSKKDYEYLTGAESYAIFVQRLEVKIIDIIIDGYEAR